MARRIWPFRQLMLVGIEDGVWLEAVPAFPRHSRTEVPRALLFQHCKEQRAAPYGQREGNHNLYLAKVKSKEKRKFCGDGR